MWKGLFGFVVGVSLAAEAWATGLNGFYVFHGPQDFNVYQHVGVGLFLPKFSFRARGAIPQGIGIVKQDMVFVQQRRANHQLELKLYYIDVNGQLMEVDTAGNVVVVTGLPPLRKLAHWGSDILLAMDPHGNVFKIEFDLVTGAAARLPALLAVSDPQRVKVIRAHGYRSIAILYEAHLSIWDYSFSRAVETVHNLPAGFNARDFIGDSLNEANGTAHTFWISGDSGLALYDTSSQNILVTLPPAGVQNVELFAWNQPKQELYFGLGTDLGQWSAGHLTIQPWVVAKHSVQPDFTLLHRRIVQSYHLDIGSVKMLAHMAGGPRANAPNAVAMPGIISAGQVPQIEFSEFGNNPAVYIRNLAKIWWQQVHGKDSELQKQIDRLTLSHMVNSTLLKELLLVQMDAGRVLIADLAALKLLMRFGEVYVVPEDQAGSISLEDFLALLTRDSSAASSCLDRLFPKWNKPSYLDRFDQFIQLRPYSRP